MSKTAIVRILKRQRARSESEWRSGTSGCLKRIPDNANEKNGYRLAKSVLSWSRKLRLSERTMSARAYAIVRVTVQDHVGDQQLHFAPTEVLLGPSAASTFGPKPTRDIGPGGENPRLSRDIREKTVRRYRRHEVKKSRQGHRDAYFAGRRDPQSGTWPTHKRNRPSDEVPRPTTIRGRFSFCERR